MLRKHKRNHGFKPGDYLELLEPCFATRPGVYRFETANAFLATLSLGEILIGLPVEVLENCRKVERDFSGLDPAREQQEFCEYAARWLEENGVVLEDQPAFAPSASPQELRRGKPALAEKKRILQ